MNRIAVQLIGMSLLVLLDGTASVTNVFPAGSFIDARDLVRAERAAVQRLTKSSGSPSWLTFGFRSKNLARRQVDGSMAITAIRRAGGGLQVDLQNQPWTGVKALVEQRGGQWVVLEVGFWIA